MTFIKKKKILFLSFIIPLLITVLIFILLGIFINGDNNILISDLRAQYLSFFNYYKSLFNGSSSLFYSFSNGLGSSTLGIIAYYLASPFNILIFLFNKANIIDIITIILILKIAVSGSTMFLYLKYHFNKENISLLIFSTCYALMSFSVNYYFNIMWFDGIYLLPLISLGIDSVINKNKYLLYGFSLFLGIITNFYIGYMLCIFSFIYYIYESYLKYGFEYKKDNYKHFFKFLKISVLIGLMASFIIIPTLSEISKNTGNVDVNKSIFTGTSIGSLFARSYIGSHTFPYMLAIDIVNIYCGIIIQILVVFYFLNKKISFKEKLASVSILLIFTMSFLIEPFNIIWHGFTIPNGMNFRYAFIFCFFLIQIAYKSFNCINGITKKDYIIYGFSFIVISILLLFINYEYLSLTSILISIIFTIFYLLILYKNKSKKANILLILLVLIELACNFYLSIDDYWFYSNESYEWHMKEFKSKINEYGNRSNYFRIEKNLNMSLNESLISDYNGISSFNSFVSNDIYKFAKQAGYGVSLNKISYGDGNTPVIDSILGIKYMFLSYVDYSSFYKVIDSIPIPPYINEYNKTVNVYENTYALGIGYLVSNNIKNYSKDEIDYNNSFEYQNYLFRLMTNSNKNVLLPYDTKIIDNENISANINNNYPMFIYVKFEDKDNDSVAIHIDNRMVMNYYDITNGIFNIKNSFHNQTVNLKVVGNNREIENSYIYYFDEDYFKEKLGELNKNNLNIEVFDNDYIKGNIKVFDENKVLFTSIPYDDNWQVYVDDIKTDYYKVFDTFIGIDLSKGAHIIEFKYYPKELNIGIIISLLTASYVVATVIRKKKKIDRT